MKGLHLHNIESGYGEKLIVKDVSLNIVPDETLVLMGPSGSGKSTLLLTILGIVSPKKGNVVVNGRDVTNLPIETRNIGYLPQDYGLFPHLSVLDNVAYGLKVRGVKKEERERTAKEMIKLVELEGYENNKIAQLSGGQRQRVGLARALAIKPDVLLLDEPLSNIDQVTKFEVAEELKKLFEKLSIPILFVTHNRDDAFFFAERLAVMIDGKIEQEGKLRDVFRKPKNSFIKNLLTPYRHRF